VVTNRKKAKIEAIWQDPELFHLPEELELQVQFLLIEESDSQHYFSKEANLEPKTEPTI